MARIGTFLFRDEQFTGTVLTLGLNVKARIVPVSDKKSDDSPDYRLLTGTGYQLGAAWAKVSRSDRGYLSVVIDDPQLPAPIYARLVESSEGDGSHDLLWSRARRAD